MKERKNIMKRILIILGIASLVVVIGIVASLFYFNSNLKPKSDIENQVVVEIPSGSGIKQVGDLLQKEGIIKNAGVFSFYAQYNDYHNLKAGKYLLSPHMNVEQVLQKINSGDVYVETVKVTIPEGYTVTQIGDLLVEKGLVAIEDFVKAVDEGVYEDIWFTKEIPESDEVVHRLEGFLFPKTYMIRKDANAEQIVELLLKQTEKEIPKEWIKELEKQNMTFYEAMTLASIIEREAASENERDKIAEVYYNRLEEDMKLQADATIQYGLGEQKERLMYSDLELESHYNTYKHEGLPPGPIANPGIEAIKATVFPAEHDYLFYVTKKDGTGEHYFAKTYKEHLKNIDKSKTN